MCTRMLTYLFKQKKGQKSFKITLFEKGQTFTVYDWNVNEGQQMLSCTAISWSPLLKSNILHNYIRLPQPW